MNEQQNNVQQPTGSNENASGEGMDNNMKSEEIRQFYNEQILSAENSDDEITNNDGSVKETLDTAFHDIPGYIDNHSLSGSNRADYYEKRSQGKSDTEEEQDYMRNKQGQP